MRIRIGCHDGSYWVEGKRSFKWVRLPSVDYFMEYKWSINNPKYIMYFRSYEMARELASEYLKRFNKNVAVYTEVKI